MPISGSGCSAPRLESSKTPEPVRERLRWRPICMTGTTSRSRPLGFVLEQGIELGRGSRLEYRVAAGDGGTPVIRVKGEVVFVGAGTRVLPPVVGGPL